MDPAVDVLATLDHLGLVKAGDRTGRWAGASGKTSTRKETIDERAGEGKPAPHPARSDSRGTWRQTGAKRLRAPQGGTAARERGRVSGRGTDLAARAPAATVQRLPAAPGAGADHRRQRRRPERDWHLCAGRKPVRL